MSPAVEAHGPAFICGYGGSGANCLINHLYKKKTEQGQEWTPLNSIYNQLGETAKPHPQQKHTIHSSADGDTPRLRSLNTSNNVLRFILSKAFDMSINTNIEIFFSSIAFHTVQVISYRQKSRFSGMVFMIATLELCQLVVIF